MSICESKYSINSKLPNSYFYLDTLLFGMVDKNASAIGSENRVYRKAL